MAAHGQLLMAADNRDARILGVATPGGFEGPVSRRPLWVVVGVVLGCVGVGVVLSHPWRSSGTGDPGGRIMAQLRPIERAIPAHAHVNYTQDIEPRLDSCDGMNRTGFRDGVDY